MTSCATTVRTLPMPFARSPGLGLQKPSGQAHCLLAGLFAFATRNAFVLLGAGRMGTEWRAAFLRKETFQDQQISDFAVLFLVDAVELLPLIFASRDAYPPEHTLFAWQQRLQPAFLPALRFVPQIACF